MKSEITVIFTLLKFRPIQMFSYKYLEKRTWSITWKGVKLRRNFHESVEQ